MPWEGTGSACPPGSHRDRNRKPQAGIYSKSSAPDHIVLSVVHLFWGQALKSLLPESAPGRPPHLCFPRRPWGEGTRPTDRLGGAPRLAGQPQARLRPLLPEALAARRSEQEVVGGSNPIPLTPALGLTFLFLQGLPQPVFLAVRTLLHFL